MKEGSISAKPFARSKIAAGMPASTSVIADASIEAEIGQHERLAQERAGDQRLEQRHNRKKHGDQVVPSISDRPAVATSMTSFCIAS